MSSMIDLNVEKTNLETELHHLEERRRVIEEKLALIARFQELDTDNIKHEEPKTVVAVEPLRVRYSEGRRSITQVRPSVFVYGSFHFKNSRELLDHFNWPNYFSKNPALTGKSDSADREILRWGRKNENLAKTVTVEFGIRRPPASLWDCIQAIS